MAKRALSEIKQLDRGESPKGKGGKIPRCGLCGKTENLTKTECCDHWICDDEDQYVMFSFAHNSCYRNHRRYTLCGGHHAEGHGGRWQDCQQCRELFETEIEMYVYYGTNEYNFEKLPNPPKHKPIRCVGCNRVIRLSYDNCFRRTEGYFCEKCAHKEFGDLIPRSADE